MTTKCFNTFVNEFPTNSPQVTFNCHSQSLQVTSSCPLQSSQIMDSKYRTSRIAVYSGTARRGCDRVYTLKELSTQFLRNNTQVISNLTGVSYALIEPVLFKCSWEELLRIESYNPSLREETDELWRAHCRLIYNVETLGKQVKNWRQRFFLEQEERENRLKCIIKRKANQEAEPVKRTKTIHTIHVTTIESKIKPTINSSLQTASSVKETVLKSRAPATKPNPPKKAPLMVKTLRMLKRQRQSFR